MHPDSQIIDKLGGTNAVARLCECRPPSVSEWRNSGIPNARRLYLLAIRPGLAEHWAYLRGTAKKEAA
jgi:hypothetical protein